MWLKVLGCIMIVVATTGIGCVYADEIRRHMEDLRTARRLAVLLRGDIRYANATLPEAIENAEQRHEGRFSGFLAAVAQGLSQGENGGFSAVWRDAVERELTATALSKRDKQALCQLGESLGLLDKLAQLDAIDWYIKTVEEELAQSTRGARERMTLYRGLGVLSGIFLILVLL